MTYGAIDLHARYSQVRVIDGEGRVLRDQKIVTNRDRLVAVFAPYRPDPDSARKQHGE